MFERPARGVLDVQKRSVKRADSLTKMDQFIEEGFIYFDRREGRVVVAHPQPPAVVDRRIGVSGHAVARY